MQEVNSPQIRLYLQKPISYQLCLGFLGPYVLDWLSELENKYSDCIANGGGALGSHTLVYKTTNVGHYVFASNQYQYHTECQVH